MSVTSIPVIKAEGLCKENNNPGIKNSVPYIQSMLHERSHPNPNTRMLLK